MIVLSEASIERYGSRSEVDNRDITQAAKLAGCTVYFIPTDFSVCENAANALWHIPEQDAETIAIWVGFIPSAERYSAIYGEALTKKIRIINSPQQHLVAQEFDLAYPLLSGITPQSVTVCDESECLAVVERLGLPVFVRGSVRSGKSAGWKACVADTPQELIELVNTFLRSEYRSRGRVIVRKLVNLRHSRFSDDGFPLGREYRVFVLNSKVVGRGYYWEGTDPLMDLTGSEKAQVEDLALEAARRLNVPFIAIDVGQLEDETWTVIEVNDAQFAGTAQIPALPLWNSILRASAP